MFPYYRRFTWTDRLFCVYRLYYSVDPHKPQNHTHTYIAHSSTLCIHCRPFRTDQKREPLIKCSAECHFSFPGAPSSHYRSGQVFICCRESQDFKQDTTQKVKKVARQWWRLNKRDTDRSNKRLLNVSMSEHLSLRSQVVHLWLDVLKFFFLFFFCWCTVKSGISLMKGTQKCFLFGPTTLVLDLHYYYYYAVLLFYFMTKSLLKSERQCLLISLNDRS